MVANSFSVSFANNNLAITSSDNSNNVLTINGQAVSVFPYVPANKAGDTFLGNVYVNSASLTVNSGNLTVNGGSAVVSGNMTIGGAGTVVNNLSVTTGAIGCGASPQGIGGDITAARNGGGAGVLYLGTGGGTYFYFDGANYQLGGWGVIASQNWALGTFYNGGGARWVFNGDTIPGGQVNGPIGFYELNPGIIDGLYMGSSSYGDIWCTGIRTRQLQVSINGGWYAVGWAS